MYIDKQIQKFAILKLRLIGEQTISAKYREQ